MTLRLLPALPGIVYPVKRLPLWSTDVQTSVSGKRTTLGYWSYPLYGFELGYEFLRSDTAFGEWQDLVSFFNLAGGRRDLWRFNDPMDHAVQNQGFGIGDGVTTTFQFVRALTGVTLAWVDPVFFPVHNTVTIFKNGVAQTGADVSLSNTGLTTWVVPPPPGAVLTWTGTFDWLVRFDEDSATFEQFTYNLFELKVLKFSTEKI